MDKLDVEERQKIASWQREKKDAASGVGWMYKGNKPDSEEYLLGKRIDKHVEGEEEEKEDEASVIFKERIKANIALDVASKMREDPLFAIRRKEEDSRKKLLENPIRMKELQKLINQQEQEKLKKEKKAKKHKKKDKKSKKKKKKTKRGSSSESDSDESDEETDIMSKYLSILTSKHSGDTGKEKDSKQNRGEDDGRNFKGGREFQDRRSQDHRRERDGRDRYQGDSNGYRGRPERRGDSNRRDTFGHRQREEWPRENERDKRGSPNREKGRGHRDHMERDHREASPESNRKGGRTRGREQQRINYSKSPEKRANSREKRREGYDRDERGKESKQKEISHRKDRRSLSSERNGRHSAKKRREESIEEQCRGRDKVNTSKKKEMKRKKSSSSSSSEASSSGEESSEGSKGEHRNSQLSKPYGLIMSKSAEEAARARKRSRSSSSSPSSKKHKISSIPKAKPVRRQPSPPIRKLTDEEKQRKLEEMMKNAEWREDQREINVKKYKEEDRERERKDNEKQSSGFISSLMVEHASSSSVEDRIRRNKYNIQRTRKDLDKNFTQK